MASETPVTDYLRMPFFRFLEFWNAISAITERRARKQREAQRKIRHTPHRAKRR